MFCKSISYRFEEFVGSSRLSVMNNYLQIFGIVYFLVFSALVAYYFLLPFEYLALDGNGQYFGCTAVASSNTRLCSI